MTAASRTCHTAVSKIAVWEILVIQHVLDVCLGVILIKPLEEHAILLIQYLFHHRIEMLYALIMASRPEVSLHKQISQMY